MYVKRIQVHNYGPIDRIDISLPIEEEVPKPVVLVGENGSGKSILLSHIVNGLLVAQQIAYPESPEVDTGKVYKLRSSTYIKSISEYYFARVDFISDLFHGEFRSLRKKSLYSVIPAGVPVGDARDAWNSMASDTNDHLVSNLTKIDRRKIEDAFNQNCILYFPANRFEEPAWLNEENLHAKANFMDLKHLQGHTDRRVINHASLDDNQKWLFDVAYDSRALEIRTRDVQFPVTNGEGKEVYFPLQQFQGYSGEATIAYESALEILRLIIGYPNARFNIGGRLDRAVSVVSDGGQLVPNIFQLSSGETGLLNLFLTILRDSDVCRTYFRNASNICGIVVIDEIDLHLHSRHQNEVLPALIQMFPRVQFVVTTHSPLFVLGMRRAFGEDGFALFRLPEGQQISPEEFSEFGDAYRAFAETTKHSRELQVAIEKARRHIVIPEGETDRQYILKAAEVLGKQDILTRLDIWEGKGASNLNHIWKVSDLFSANLGSLELMLLYDGDTRQTPAYRDKTFKRVIPLNEQNPVQKGIENLFGEETLVRARQQNASFINECGERIDTLDGENIVIPATWSVNSNQKMNLCNWLCENGTADDFRGFEVVFELLQELFEDEAVQSEVIMET